MGTSVVFTAAGQGSAGYDYQFYLVDAATAVWTMVQDYGNGATWTMPANTPANNYWVAVFVRTSRSFSRDALSTVYYPVVASATATGVTLTPSLPSPVTFGTPVVFTAAGQGASGYDYQFYLVDAATAVWTLVQPYGNGATWTMPGTTPANAYWVAVFVRTSPSVQKDTYATLYYVVQ
jgi:hypothetical protein